jgi:hypothetical protein
LAGFQGLHSTAGWGHMPAQAGVVPMPHEPAVTAEGRIGAWKNKTRIFAQQPMMNSTAGEQDDSTSS